jgi:pimeloyl-ACP methyl ester carboxylesterase
VSFTWQEGGAPNVSATQSQTGAASWRWLRYWREMPPAENVLAYRRDFTAALKQLRSDGARHVFLIGASMGGAAAVETAADCR